MDQSFTELPTDEEQQEKDIYIFKNQTTHIHQIAKSQVNISPLFYTIIPNVFPLYSPLTNTNILTKLTEMKSTLILFP